MKPTEIKQNLNKKVMYQGHEYTMKSAIFWKKGNEYEYSVELVKDNHCIRCGLKDVEVIP